MPWAVLPRLTRRVHERRILAVDRRRLSVRVQIAERIVVLGLARVELRPCRIGFAEERRGGERIVVILPDNVRNYMSKFLDPKWRAERGV